MFWIAYFLSPRFCHRFVGYLEEEAVKTYTHCLEVGGKLKLQEGSDGDYYCSSCVEGGFLSYYITILWPIYLGLCIIVL